jgi:hypothetical protein
MIQVADIMGAVCAGKPMRAGPESFGVCYPCSLLWRQAVREAVTLTLRVDGLISHAPILP